MPSYPRRTLAQYYLEADMPPGGAKPAEVYPLLVKLANDVRQEWLTKVRANQVPWFMPLKDATIEEKRRRGDVTPETPLVGRGQLLRQIKRWKPRVSMFYEGMDAVYRVQMGPGSGEDLECVIKDMLWGNPAVGQGRKASVPSRPIKATAQGAQRTRRDAEEWLGTFYAGAPGSGDPELIAFRVNQPSRWT